MTARTWGEHGCRRYGGCRPGDRCLEHRRTAAPVRVADLIAQALAHIGRSRPQSAAVGQRAAQ